ncbi:hypothetical protein [Ruegeria atlantica]|uniref:hypothetical protein n=1 Tax=Ruegeria atlantica TaxID=81569 RepID=UPI002495A593|nr:hypothetical protein [Ruegeria atlantica]
MSQILTGCALTDGPTQLNRLHWVVAPMLAVPAFVFAAKTMKLFVLEGYGTPAPWDPPQRIVVGGPYRYVRNTMLSSAIRMTLAEAVAFGF